MTKRWGILLGILATGIGSALAENDAGIYGRLDLGHLAKPQVIQDKPVKVTSSFLTALNKPIYVHVPPGQERHWSRHCRDYDACGVPVYFVTENWFVNVYLPAVGAEDGREQRYREQAGRVRDPGLAAERRYDAHPE